MSINPLSDAARKSIAGMREQLTSTAPLSAEDAARTAFMLAIVPAVAEELARQGDAGIPMVISIDGFQWGVLNAVLTVVSCACDAVQGESWESDVRAMMSDLSKKMEWFLDHPGIHRSVSTAIDPVGQA